MKIILSIISLLLVTSVVSAEELDVGFDNKGNVLYIEYYPYNLKKGNCTLMRMKKINTHNWIKETFYMLHNANKCVIVFDFPVYGQPGLASLQKLVLHLKLPKYIFVSSGYSGKIVSDAMSKGKLPRLYAFVGIGDTVTIDYLSSSMKKFLKELFNIRNGEVK
jgi:hypothetical protein